MSASGAAAGGGGGGLGAAVGPALEGRRVSDVVVLSAATSAAPSPPRRAVKRVQPPPAPLERPGPPEPSEQELDARFRVALLERRRQLSDEHKATEERQRRLAEVKQFSARVRQGNAAVAPPRQAVAAPATMGSAALHSNGRVGVQDVDQSLSPARHALAANSPASSALRHGRPAGAVTPQPPGGPATREFGSAAKVRRMERASEARAVVARRAETSHSSGDENGQSHNEGPAIRGVAANGAPATAAAGAVATAAAAAASSASRKARKRTRDDIAEIMKQQRLRRQQQLHDQEEERRKAREEALRARLVARQRYQRPPDSALPAKAPAGATPPRPGRASRSGSPSRSRSRSRERWADEKRTDRVRPKGEQKRGKGSRDDDEKEASGETEEGKGEEEEERRKALEAERKRRREAGREYMRRKRLEEQQQQRARGTERPEQLDGQHQHVHRRRRRHDAAASGADDDSASDEESKQRRSEELRRYVERKRLERMELERREREELKEGQRRRELQLSQLHVFCRQQARAAAANQDRRARTSRDELRETRSIEASESARQAWLSEPVLQDIRDKDQSNTDQRSLDSASDAKKEAVSDRGATAERAKRPGLQEDRQFSADELREAELVRARIESLRHSAALLAARVFSLSAGGGAQLVGGRDAEREAAPLRDGPMISLPAEPMATAGPMDSSAQHLVQEPALAEATAERLRDELDDELDPAMLVSLRNGPTPHNYGATAPSQRPSAGHALHAALGAGTHDDESEFEEEEQGDRVSGEENGQFEHAVRGNGDTAHAPSRSVEARAAQMEEKKRPLVRGSARAAAAAAVRQLGASLADESDVKERSSPDLPSDALLHGKATEPDLLAGLDDDEELHATALEEEWARMAPDSPRILDVLVAYVRNATRARPPGAPVLPAGQHARAPEEAGAPEAAKLASLHTQPAGRRLPPATAPSPQSTALAAELAPAPLSASTMAALRPEDTKPDAGAEEKAPTLPFSPTKPEHATLVTDAQQSLSLAAPAVRSVLGAGDARLPQSGAHGVLPKREPPPPVFPAPREARVAAAAAEAGATEERSEGPARLSPRSLTMQLTSELQLIEAMEESQRKLLELAHSRALSVVEREAAGLVDLLQVRQRSAQQRAAQERQEFERREADHRAELLQRAQEEAQRAQIETLQQRVQRQDETLREALAAAIAAAAAASSSRDAPFLGPSLSTAASATMTQEAPGRLPQGSERPVTAPVGLARAVDFSAGSAEPRASGASGGLRAVDGDDGGDDFVLVDLEDAPHEHSFPPSNLIRVPHDPESSRARLATEEEVRAAPARAAGTFSTSEVSVRAGYEEEAEVEEEEAEEEQQQQQERMSEEDEEEELDHGGATVMKHHSEEAKDEQNEDGDERHKTKTQRAHARELSSPVENAHRPANEQDEAELVDRSADLVSTEAASAPKGVAARDDDSDDAVEEVIDVSPRATGLPSADASPASPASIEEVIEVVASPPQLAPLSRAEPVREAPVPAAIPAASLAASVQPSADEAQDMEEVMSELEVEAAEEEEQQVEVVAETKKHDVLKASEQDETKAEGAGGQRKEPIGSEAAATYEEEEYEDEFLPEDEDPAVGALEEKVGTLVPDAHQVRAESLQPVAGSSVSEQPEEEIVVELEDERELQPVESKAAEEPSVAPKPAPLPGAPQPAPHPPPLLPPPPVPPSSLSPTRLLPRSSSLEERFAHTELAGMMASTLSSRLVDEAIAAALSSLERERQPPSPLDAARQWFKARPAAEQREIASQVADEILGRLVSEGAATAPAGVPPRAPVDAAQVQGQAPASAVASREEKAELIANELAHALAMDAVDELIAVQQHHIGGSPSARALTLEVRGVSFALQRLDAPAQGESTPRAPVQAAVEFSADQVRSLGVLVAPEQRVQNDWASVRGYLESLLRDSRALENINWSDAAASEAEQDAEDASDGDSGSLLEETLARRHLHQRRRGRTERQLIRTEVYLDYEHKLNSGNENQQIYNKLAFDALNEALLQRRPFWQRYPEPWRRGRSHLRLHAELERWLVRHGLPPVANALSDAEAIERLRALWRPPTAEELLSDVETMFRATPRHRSFQLSNSATSALLLAGPSAMAAASLSLARAQQPPSRDLSPSPLSFAGAPLHASSAHGAAAAASAATSPAASAPSSPPDSARSAPAATAADTEAMRALVLAAEDERERQEIEMVDALLTEELRRDREDWTNFEEEESRIESEVSDGILTALLDEIVVELNEMELRRSRRR